MNNLKLINEYNAEKLYNHYKDVDRKTFDIITNVPKKTIYIEWLINLYKHNNLKLEDMEKADKYISIFNKPNVYKKLGGILKIKELKSIQELFKLIKPYYTNKILNPSDKDDFILNKCFVKEFKNYNLYIPKSHEDAIYLGKNTQWCTSIDSKNGLFNFNQYTIDGDLYIFINKEKPNVKYQLHIETAQFRNAYDETIFDDSSFVYRFVNNNEDIMNYIKSISLQMHMYIIVSTMNMKLIDNLNVNNFLLYSTSGDYDTTVNVYNLENLEQLKKILIKIHVDELWFEYIIIKYNGKYVTNFSKYHGFQNPDNLTEYFIDDFHANDSKTLVDEIIKVLEK